MPVKSLRLELAELLNRLASSGKHAENVESYGLAERAALANGNVVTFLNTESGRAVDGDVLVALLVSGVLADEVQVLASYDDCSVHLRGDNL